MRFVKAARAAACIGLLAGCAPQLSETGLAASREALKGSPALQQKQVSICVQKIRQNPSKVQDIATLTNLPASRAPEVFCERFLTATMDGRLNYAQYLEARKGSSTPELVRIAQGR
jgi:hypothetical protein